MALRGLLYILLKYNKYEQNYASVSVPPPPAPHKLGIAGNLKPDLHYKNKRFDKG
jgi:hypothetical protein